MLVGFLSTMLPGVREFRTPFVIGALWATVGYLLLWHVHGARAGARGLSGTLSEMLNQFAAPIKAGVLGFSVYLLGLVFKGVSEWFTESPMRSALIDKFAATRVFQRVTNILLRLPLLNGDPKDYLADAARERFAEFPPTVREVARRILIDEYKLADVILASKSPEQYQEYDRVRSEAEFRNGVWVPLFLVSVGVGLLTTGPATWAIIVAGGAASVMLKLQGIDRRVKSNERLASAIYFNLASTPLFDALFSEMQRAVKADGTRKRPRSDVDLIAAMVDFLAVRKLEQLVHFAMTLEPDRRHMKQVLNGTRRETKAYVSTAASLQELMVVAYGGIEWDSARGGLSESISVPNVMAARRRIDDFLSIQAEYDYLDTEDLAEDGVVKVVGERQMAELRGGETDREWEVAVRAINSEMSKFASRVELAFEAD